jgi:hypothetical protein
MLNKDGSHGQGDLFLRKLFLICGLEPKISAEYNYKVVREDATRYIEYSNRRIDITIDCGDFGIGIENKPRACEQENQISDYAEHLSKKHEKYLLLYLSGNGKEPESIDEQILKSLKEKKMLITLPYRGGLTKWVNYCRNECNSDKYRWFLKDFIEYINNTIPFKNNKDGENV